MLFLLALTGCSKDEAGNDSDAPVPVRFEAGSPEVFKSRTEINTLDDLKDPEKNPNGFGVFAYYTGATAWGDVGSSTTPNFMYNQQVTWSSDHWTYTPVKYWPNADGEKVSFFAYAPYTSNTTGFSTNTDAGAPIISYTWGTTNDLLYDKQIDQVKGTVSSAVTFTFKHALAKVEFKIRRKYNSGPPVTLKSLSIGLYTSGTFNLGTESWTSPSVSGSRTICSTDLAVTEYTAETAQGLGSSMLVIPDLKYTINYTIDGNEYTHNNVSITGLNKGNSYTIIFTIDGDVIKVDTQKFTEQW
jgi:hypothetical protein